MYCNLETIIAVSPYGLTIRRVSTRSDEKPVRRVILKRSANGRTDTGGYTIILRHYRVVGYKKEDFKCLNVHVYRHGRHLVQQNVTS